MRRKSPVTPRSLQRTLAILAAIAGMAISRTPSHAQPATYDQQLSYYDPAIPFSAALPSNLTYGSYSTLSDPSSAAGVSRGTDTGGIAYVGNYGGGALDGADSVSFFRIQDDSNFDGTTGAIIIVQDGPNGESQLSMVTDFDDLHTFNIGFNQISVVQQTTARSFDAGGVYWIFEEGGVRPDPNREAAERAEVAVKNLPREPSSVRRGTGSNTIALRATEPYRMMPTYSKFAAGHRRAGVGLLYGYDEFGIVSRFRFDAEGGILGKTFSDTRSYNWVTGPYSGLVAHKSLGPINFYGHALGVLGLNDGDIEQTNGIGAELIPGALNRQLYAGPTFSTNRVAIDDVAPTGVLWAEAGLQITERSSLKFAWTALYVNNILMSADRVLYRIPDMGFRDPGEQDYLEQFFYCGIEIVR